METYTINQLSELGFPWEDLHGLSASMGYSGKHGTLVVDDDVLYFKGVSGQLREFGWRFDGGYGAFMSHTIYVDILSILGAD